MALRLEDAFEEENDLIRRILEERERGGGFQVQNINLGTHNLLGSQVDQSGQFAPFETNQSSAEEESSEFKIVFSVKEALEKYREMKIELLTLEIRQKDLANIHNLSYGYFRELKDINLKFNDYYIKTSTRTKYLEFEKALLEDLDTFRQASTKEQWELNVKMRKLKSKIAHITQFIKEGVRGEIPDEEIQRMRDPNLCAICVDNKVTHVFNPCGHTVCEGCIDPTLTRCHLCRRQIMNKIKIFFS